MRCIKVNFVCLGIFVTSITNSFVNVESYRKVIFILWAFSLRTVSKEQMKLAHNLSEHSTYNILSILPLLSVWFVCRHKYWTSHACHIDILECSGTVLQPFADQRSLGQLLNSVLGHEVVRLAVRSLNESCSTGLLRTAAVQSGGIIHY